MEYWVGFALLSFAVTFVYGLEKYVGLQIPWVEIPDFLAALAFGLGIFAVQTAQNIFGNESMLGHLTTQFQRVFGQLDHALDLIERNEELKRDIIDGNRELKSQVKEINKKIDKVSSYKLKEGEKQG